MLLADALKRLLTLVPKTLNAAKHTIVIRATNNAYSAIEAPASSRRNLLAALLSQVMSITPGYEAVEPVSNSTTRRSGPDSLIDHSKEIH